jgi:nucleotidyltransferase substrate binding protein (TIGR01987 family)
MMGRHACRNVPNNPHAAYTDAMTSPERSAIPLDLTALRDALASLRRALIRWQSTREQDEELRDACIQRFEYTFELSWKMLARRLERDLPDARSVDAMSFRELMRSGGERGLVRDVDIWMVFRDKRNTTSHAYNAAKAADVAAIIPTFANEAQELLARLQTRGAADA